MTEPFVLLVLLRWSHSTVLDSGRGSNSHCGRWTVIAIVHWSDEKRRSVAPPSWWHPRTWQVGGCRQDGGATLTTSACLVTPFHARWILVYGRQDARRRESSAPSASSMPSAASDASRSKSPEIGGWVLTD